jgi:hypothetical protein
MNDVAISKLEYVLNTTADMKFPYASCEKGKNLTPEDDSLLGYSAA